MFKDAGFSDSEAFRQHVLNQLKEIVADLFRAAIEFPLGIFPLQNTFDMFGACVVLTWTITHDRITTLSTTSILHDRTGGEGTGLWIQSYASLSENDEQSVRGAEAGQAICPYLMHINIVWAVLCL